MLSKQAIDQISRQVINEAGSSNLPGKENGPYDAYRHLLISAELTRLYGEAAARAILGYHELEGNLRDGQRQESEAMDRNNNEIGIGIEKDAQSRDEIVRKSREALKSDAHNI